MPDSIDIKKLIAHGEGQSLEFKSSFSEELLETISAFANADGGIILVGVDDNGTIRGVQVGKGTVTEWANRIQSAIDPRLQPAIQIVPGTAGKHIGIIKVSPAVSMAVSTSGRFLKRVGNTNQRMSSQEIAQRLVATMRPTWDSVPCMDVSLDDLDIRAVRHFIAAVKRTKRRPLPEKAQPFAVLEKFGLIQGNQPTRAAVLLFGKDPQKYFSSAYIKVGRFRSETLIVDDKEIAGNLFAQVEQAMDWFRDRLETAFVITGKPQRDVVWEYPLDALREAIVNAVCHRSYNSLATIQIRLYDYTVEFWNPGGLSPPLTAESLVRKHESVSRNKKIQEMLFYAGLSEQWGTGTLRMAELLQAAGCPAPMFDVESPDRFRLAFNKQLAPGAPGLAGLNERQIAAVQFVAKGEKLTNLLYQERFQTQKRTATRELVELVEKRILAKHGTTGKGTYYTLAIP